MRKKIRVVLETNAKEERPLKPCGSYDGGAVRQQSHLGNESGLAESSNVEVAMHSGKVDRVDNLLEGASQKATSHTAPSCDTGAGEAQDGIDDSVVARDKLVMKHIVKLK